MKIYTMCRWVLWISLATCFLAMGATGSTDVYPTNTPSPADQNAIQAAIDALGSGGGTVVLHGTFNFGPNDGVRIVQPNVTLTGTDDATIIGGGKQNPAAGVWYVIGIENVGVRISELTLKDFKMAGILVRTQTTNPADNPVVIENNTISTSNVYMNSFSFGIYVRMTGCPVKILNNSASTARIVLYARLNTGDITVSGNTLTGWIGMGSQQNSRDVIVTGNTLNGSVQGAYIVQTTGRCIITDNTVNGSPTSQGIHVGGNPGTSPVVISANTIRGAMDGIAFHDLGLTDHSLTVEISNNTVEPAFTGPPGYFSDGAVGWANYCPVNIESNTVRVIADRPGDNPTCDNFGLLLYGRDATKGLNQDNPPVLVRNNRFEIRYPFPEQPTPGVRSVGIQLALWNTGFNNVTLQSNKISGTTAKGISVNSYCRNILIKENDLSELMTWSAQMSLYGKEMVVQDNVLGFAEQIPGYSYGIELASVRQHDTLPMPYPTENCVLARNDYRRTGLPGWSLGDNGCIAIQSYADLSALGNEVRNNLVSESGMFPPGTGGAKDQIFELKTSSGLVHDNRIVGLAAAGLSNPGIGQRLRSAGAHSVGQRAALQEAMARKAQQGMLEEDQPAKPGAAPPLSPDELLSPAPPAAPELLGNYPNPFNPTTSIRYSIPTACKVTIAVFNTLGEMVTCLLNAEQSAGYHEVRFDASGLVSGMYICRLQAGSAVQTSRLLLMK